MFMLMLVRLVQDSVKRYQEWKDDPDGSKKAMAEKKAMEAIMQEGD